MAGVCFLASYPKSGNTWLRSLLSVALRPDQDVDLGDLMGPNVLIDSRWFEQESGLDPAAMTLEQIDVVRSHLLAVWDARADSPAFVKTHARADSLMNGNRWSSPPGRAIVIVRHPFDVAVSYASFVSRSIDGIIGAMGNRDAVIDPAGRTRRNRLAETMGSWSDNVASWLDVDCDKLVVRYEDMQADTAGSLAAMLSFAGLSIPAERLEQAVAATAIDRLRDIESEVGFGDRSRAAAPMFRSGRTGEGRDDLDLGQQTALVASCGDVMERLGYRPDGTAGPLA